MRLIAQSHLPLPYVLHRHNFTRTSLAHSLAIWLQCGIYASWIKAPGKSTKPKQRTIIYTMTLIYFSPYSASLQSTRKGVAAGTSQKWESGIKEASSKQCSSNPFMQSLLSCSQHLSSRSSCIKCPFDDHNHQSHIVCLLKSGKRKFGSILSNRGINQLIKQLNPHTVKTAMKQSDQGKS